MISTSSVASCSRISRRHFRRSFRSLPALAVTVASILVSERSLFVPASPSCAARGGLPSSDYTGKARDSLGKTEGTEPATATQEGGSGNIGGEGEKDSEFWERVRRSGSMSWTCHGETNGQMVDKLLRSGIVQSEGIAEAMKQIDRADFVLTKSRAYDDSPQPIGFNATISAPHMHGYCLSILEKHLQPGNRVLDVGSGSGYLTAVMALLVGPTGRAVGVEHIPELVERSRAAVKAGRAAELMEKGQLSIHEADGREGYPDAGPYDAIHVGAAAPELPQALVDQLKPGGRLVIPIGRFMQDLEVIDKAADGTVTRTSAMGVRYVPLTAKDRQLEGH
ncbi:hypothetical protein CLOM_g6797 [Closterium sp. NIES-68]|nr:hypothetical protein CLOM_g6797 [Closterium sp. NIES-68]GJP72332.1 hypothetical protein CLOP_g3074 [Closterium sp. NIES-67]